MLCNEMRSHPTPDGSSRLVIYLFCACVRVCVCAKKGEKGGAEQPGGGGSPHSLVHSLVPGATGATVTVRIQPRALGSEVFFWGGRLGGAGAISGPPVSRRLRSKCSRSMSFGVRGGRRGPRIKAHPINLNPVSSRPGEGVGLGARGVGGGRFVGAGKRARHQLSAVAVCAAV